MPVVTCGVCSSGRTLVPDLGTPNGARFDDMVAALRDTTGPACGEGHATRRRVLVTLEKRASGRRRRITATAVAVLVGAATVSWAATEGRFQPWLIRIGLRMPTQVVGEVAPELAPTETA